MTKPTLAVIGAGASGMMAALTAAERGHRVLLLERQARAGRKLMATGNGRCNITNMEPLPSRYHGAEADFPRPAMDAFPPEAALRYFKGLGLLTVEEWGGRVYPLSNSANSVVDVLRYALENAGVELLAARPARSIRKRGGVFTIDTDDGSVTAERVVVACGGAAGEKLGGGKDGYELLKSLGHSRTPIYPALAQITVTSAYPRSLKGIKADAALTLTEGGRVFARSYGEVLFTEVGVSGPAAFDLSRAVSTAGERSLTLYLDFLRDYSDDETLELLRARRAAAPTLPSAELFTGALHNRLGRMAAKFAGLDPEKPLGELTDAELRFAANAAKRFELPVRGTDGFQNAQVTAGGVKTSEFFAETLESRIMPGLFACGEVLDVDGDCGGFNLQWAWASGRLAGRLGE